MHATSETDTIWRNIGRLEASVIAIRRELDQMRRDMRESRRKGIPLWGHIAAMGLISGLSALGLIRPEVALALVRLIFKSAAG